eukprot:Awhi_evm1s8894
MFSPFILVVSTLLCREVHSHGYIQVPAARNSMWKYGFDNPPNYDLMGLAAGGPGVVAASGHGLCGDNINDEQRHMSGGVFGNGVISMTYITGQIIDIEIIVTAHHKGHFQFRICDLPEGSGNNVQATQQCLDENVLQLADGSGTDWPLPPSQGSQETYKMSYVLPQGLTCSRCVFQWYWETGNSPGAYPEEFWNCADIKITHQDGSIDPTNANNPSGGGQVAAQGSPASGRSMSVGCLPRQGVAASSCIPTHCDPTQCYIGRSED